MVAGCVGRRIARLHLSACRTGAVFMVFDISSKRLLGAALIKYESGDAPSDAKIVQLKRLLFCNPRSPAIFRAAEWNAWTDDDSTPGQAL